MGSFDDGSNAPEPGNNLVGSAFLLLIACVATFNCSILILSLSRLASRQFSTSLFFGQLIFGDFPFSLFGILNHVLLFANNSHFFGNEKFCKFMAFWAHFSGSTAVLLFSLIAVERKLKVVNRVNLNTNFVIGIFSVMVLIGFLTAVFPLISPELGNYELHSAHVVCYSRMEYSPLILTLVFLIPISISISAACYYSIYKTLKESALAVNKMLRDRKSSIPAVSTNPGRNNNNTNIENLTNNSSSPIQNQKYNKIQPIPVQPEIESTTATATATATIGNNNFVKDSSNPNNTINNNSSIPSSSIKLPVSSVSQFERRTSFIMFLIWGIFVFGWSPVGIAFVFGVFGVDLTNNEPGMDLLICLGAYSVPLWNSVVYLTLNQQVNNEVKKSFPRFAPILTRLNRWANELLMKFEFQVTKQEQETTQETDNFDDIEEIIPLKSQEHNQQQSENTATAAATAASGSGSGTGTNDSLVMINQSH